MNGKQHEKQKIKTAPSFMRFCHRRVTELGIDTTYSMLPTSWTVTKIQSRAMILRVRETMMKKGISHLVPGYFHLPQKKLY
jgi:hypothetical protein